MGAQIFVLPSTPVLNGNLYGSYHIVYVKYEIVVLFLFISFFKGYLNLKKKKKKEFVWIGSEGTYFSGRVHMNCGYH